MKKYIIFSALVLLINGFAFEGKQIYKCVAKEKMISDQRDKIIKLKEPIKVVFELWYGKPVKLIMNKKEYKFKYGMKKYHGGWECNNKNLEQAVEIIPYGTEGIFRAIAYSLDKRTNIFWRYPLEDCVEVK